MNKTRSAYILTALATLICQGAGLEAKAVGVVDGNTAFAFNLYGQLQTQKGNLFLSPYSISTALAMTYGGARGDTAAQMAEAMRFELKAEELHPAFAELAKGLNAVQQKGKVKLAVANALWPQKGNDFLPAYLELCQSHYGVSIAPVDFAKATETARKTINTWVEDQTNQKIKELLKPGMLDSNTRLVLGNAIYFKGDWASQFEKAQTRTEPFHLTADKTADAAMMKTMKKFRYAETAELQVVELPYAGNDLSMLVLLPRQVDGLAGLEKGLDVARYAGWTKNLRPREVQLVLPKFKMTSEFGLNQALAALGMRDAFTPKKADFSGMDGKQDLYISAVVHKAFVDVNEEGTEAAAATGVAITTLSLESPQKPVVFRADHPFLFVIRENRTGSILFLGRVADPGIAPAGSAAAEPKPGKVAWEEMVSVINSHKLSMVTQLHSREVSITTEEGETYQAQEPQIDLIFKVVQESGFEAPPMATE